tara:strand:- start:16946 stop:17362 length:417 start_codon:yes stop_codon:yes gene_type:complete
MKRLILIVSVFLSSLTYSQNLDYGTKLDGVEKEDKIYDEVEENPEFPGGNAYLYKYLAEDIKYPEMAKENGIQGKVFVQFVVWKDGTIRDVKVVKGVHKTLDNEALRVVKEMPKWKPGKQDGKAVNARFTMPIKFRIS